MRQIGRRLGFFMLTAAIAITGPAAFASVVPTRTEKAPSQTALHGLAGQVNAVIEAHASQLDRQAPAPDANTTDTGVVVRRIQALEELDAFARMTIEGLVAASPSEDDQTAAREQLAPVVSRYNQKMTALIAGLKALPCVQAERPLSARPLSDRIARLTDQVARRNAAFLDQN